MIELDSSSADASRPPPRTRAWQRHLGAALGSLKLRITLGVFAALVLGIGLIAFQLVNRAERDTLQIQRQRELSETARTAALLSRNVIGLQRDLRAAASQLDAATLTDDEAVAVFLEGQRVLGSHFDSVFVTALDGHTRVLLDSAGQRRPMVQLGDRSYFQRTLAEERAIVSEPVASRLTGDPLVVLTQPVRGAGGIAAVLGGTLTLANRDLIADLVNAEEIEAQALLVVTDAQGQVLAHTDRQRVMRPVSEEPRLAAAYDAWVAQGSPIEPTGLALPQAGEVVSAAGVAGPDWVVWRVRPEAELLAPLRTARQHAMGWAAGLIALLSITTLAYLRWLLQPMVLLERRAQHLFDGSVESHAGWPEATGEIGRLGRVLRHVAAERAQLESFNTQVLRKLGSVMKAAPIGIAFTRDHRFELVSAEFCRLLGQQEDALLGQPTRMALASDDEYARFLAAVHDAFIATRSYVGEHLMQRADGTTFWAGLRGNPVDSTDPYAGAIWTMADISDQRSENEQLAWSATHDALTGLANRKLFEKRAGGLVAGGALSLPATLVFIDLDRFKPINDSAGHAAGDAMLRAVAAALGSVVRASDLVARLGGDEFALLLERCGPEVAARIAETARAAVCAIALPWDGRTLTVGASLGIASLADNMLDVAQWVSAADGACYAAKAAGRGVVRIAAANSPRPAVSVFDDLPVTTD